MGHVEDAVDGVVHQLSAGAGTAVIAEQFGRLFFLEMKGNFNTSEVGCRTLCNKMQQYFIYVYFSLYQLSN